MDERLRFVARLLEGEKMAALCREFDVSRKTGYKIFQRYKDCGLEGLTDRSRRPYRQANQLPLQIETLIVRLKRERPSWGAPKIREKLRRRHSDVPTPAISTVHAVLDRHGLVSRGRKRRYKAQGTPLSRPLHPNDLWCADYKGEFMLADRRYCYPLTITDFASRYLLTCEALSTTQEVYAFTVFERVFKEFGLPWAIRTDNGVPFASPHALFGLSKLSVWWLRLGIHIERIKPGHPAAEWPPRAHAPDTEEGGHQAGRPELPAAAGQVRRLHRLLQPGAPASGARHEVSGGALPALNPSVSRPRRARTTPSTTEPSPSPNAAASASGGERSISAPVFAGQNVGVKEVSDKIWLVSFMDYDLGFFDHETGRLEPPRTPSPQSVTHVSGIKRYLCVRNGPLICWWAHQDSNLGPAD